MKKLHGLLPSAVLLSAVLTASLLGGCSPAPAESAADDSNVVYVYNWGEYIDPDVITMFEDETGIRVVYDEFETNEIMALTKAPRRTMFWALIVPSFSAVSAALMTVTSGTTFFISSMASCGYSAAPVRTGIG